MRGSSVPAAYINDGPQYEPHRYRALQSYPSVLLVAHFLEKARLR
jgi:hypothetical protein